MPGGPAPHSGRVAFSSSSSFSIYLDRNDFESHHFSVYVHVFSALIVIVAGAFVITIIYRLVPLFFIRRVGRRGLASPGRSLPPDWAPLGLVLLG